MESIVQDRKECLVCHIPYSTSNRLHKHHVFGGAANRRISDDNGFTVWLCGRHHNLSPEGVHFDRELDLSIKTMVQTKYEENHSRDEFRRLIGKSYL